MGKKRILAIVPTYYPQTGGAEKAVYELYKGIADEYTTDLLCPDYGGKKEEFNGFFKIYRVCKTTKILPLKLIKYQYFAYQKARKLLKEKKYDIIHCHYILPSGVAGVFLKKKFKVPLVITENHFGSGLEIISQEENPAILMPIMRFIAKKADALVSISRSQDLFLDELGKGKFKYTTIHLGGDSEVSEKSKEQLLKELKIAHNKRIIFSVSRLVKRKNYDDLIRAANEVCKKRKDVLFLIGGKGPEHDSLQALISEFGLEDNVKLLGFVSDNELEKYRKVADVFVSTSDYEGAGIIYFEAFASRMPLFAKRNYASEEAIKDDYNGKLFNTYQELAKIILKYAFDSKKLDFFRKNGYESFRKTYNWKKYCEKYKKLYAQTIKQNKNQQPRPKGRGMLVAKKNSRSC